MTASAGSMPGSSVAWVAASAGSPRHRVVRQRRPDCRHPSDRPSSVRARPDRCTGMPRTTRAPSSSRRACSASTSRDIPPSMPSSPSPAVARPAARAPAAAATPPASDAGAGERGAEPGCDEPRRRRRRGGSRRRRGSAARPGDRARASPMRVRTSLPRLRSWPIVSGGRSRSRYARHAPRQPMMRRTLSSHGFSGMPRDRRLRQRARRRPAAPRSTRRAGRGATIGIGRGRVRRRGARTAPPRVAIALGAEVDAEPADLGRCAQRPAEAIGCLHHRDPHADLGALERRDQAADAAADHDDVRCRARAPRGRRASRVRRPRVHPRIAARAAAAGVHAWPQGPPRCETGGMTLHITGDAAADRLLTDDPLALLIGMLLDQQVAMETAFAGPLKIQQRIGSVDAATLAALRPRRARRGVPTAPGGPPIPRIHGRAGAGTLRRHRAGLGRRCIRDVDPRRTRRRGGAAAAEGPSRLRRAEGEDLPGAAGQAVRLRRATGGARRPAHTAKRGRSAVSPTSCRPTRSRRCGSTSGRSKSAAKGT